MKKSQLERLIRVELEKTLTEVTRNLPFWYNALSRAAGIAERALEPNADEPKIDDATKESFRQIHELVAYTFNTLAAESTKSGTPFKIQPLK